MVAAPLNDLRAETVLGMKVRQRQNQWPAAGELLGAIQHFLAVDRTHAGVHHKRRPAAENDADIRHQRDAPVGDHVNAGGDLLERRRIDIWSRRLRRGSRAARSITHGANLLRHGLAEASAIGHFKLKTSRSISAKSRERDERLMSDALLALHFQNDICHPRRADPVLARPQHRRGGEFPVRQQARAGRGATRRLDHRAHSYRLCCRTIPTCCATAVCSSRPKRSARSSAAHGAQRPLPASSRSRTRSW